jgi:DNA-directed RNA polymerase subunit RPC12/RpoP
MPERLITIATFNEVTEAHILKGRLESEGILCFLGDEHIVGAHPFYAVAVGGVKLKVTENDVEEAKAILKNIRQGDTLYDYDTIDMASSISEESAATKTVKCPSCGSNDTAVRPYFLEPLFGTKYKCHSCGNSWKV